MSAWTRFIDQLARDEDPSEDFIRSRLSDDVLRAWIERESEMLTPYQVLSDVLEEMREFESTLALETVKAPNPLYVTWRLFRDAARRCAIRDAGREAHAAQLAEAERRPCDADDRGDYEYESRKDRRAKA